MEKFELGKTGLMCAKIGFGALPLQRADKAEAVRIIKRAHGAGINFYDTARFYTDSEEKLGEAFKGIRDDVVLASKVSGAATGSDVTNLIETSLKQLKTDRIDLMQFHNTPFMPQPGGSDGMYEAMAQAKAAGKVLHIGLTNHKIEIVLKAIESGLYETVQYPLSYISTPEEIAILEDCEQSGVGFLAMKPLAGGLLNNAAAVYWFFEEHKGKCLPLYGIQRMEELEEFLSFIEKPPLKEAVLPVIENDRKELSGDFCRGCGYCLPCPAGIELPMVTRMYHLLRRSPVAEWVTSDWRAKMQKTKECQHCGACDERCPYGLNPQGKLKAQYDDYIKVYADYHSRGG